MKSLLCSLAIVGAASGMGSDYNSNSPGSNHQNLPGATPYFYSEIHSNEYDVEDAETDCYPSSSQTDYEDVSDSASIVASSLLYEGGCLVSSQAMMCNGGGEVGGDSATTTTNNNNQFLDNLWLDDHLQDDFSDEDEDDGDDDGHSSMLSTASLRRRTPVGAGGSTSSRTKESYSSSDVSTSEPTYFESEIHLQRRQQSGSRPLARASFGLFRKALR